MAIEQVNGTTTNTSASTTSLSINAPTGVVAGDVLIAGISSDGTVPTPPSQWTEFAAGSNANWNMRFYWKKATTEPSFYTWTVGNVGPSVGFITAWRGVDAVNPILVLADRFTDATISTEPSTGPGVTTTAPGRLFYARGVRRTTAGGTAPTLTSAASGVSRRTSVGAASSSGNTAYSVGFFSADAEYGAPGAATGIAISSTPEENTNYEVTFALRAAPAATVGASLWLPAVALQGRHRIDATFPVVLPKLAVDMEGQGAPPSGSLATVLPKLAVDVEASGVGGGFTAPLPRLGAEAVGSVNPIGAFTVGLPQITPDFLLETRPFGAHVILVDPEKRGIEIRDNSMKAILLTEVRIPPGESSLEVVLPQLRMTAYGQSTSGFFDIELPLLKSALEGELVEAQVHAELPPLNVGFTGELVQADMVFELPSLEVDFTGNREAAGSLEADLWLPQVDLVSAGTFGSVETELPLLEMVEAFEGFVGNQDGVLDAEIPLPTVEFDGTAIEEDLLKYAANIGNGSATSFTVTHNFGSRDVVVCVYDNSTYEEVMPLTTHATTNTVSVAFAAAPATDAYRVVVLYSST